MACTPVIKAQPLQNDTRSDFLVCNFLWEGFSSRWETAAARFQGSPEGRHKVRSSGEISAAPK